MSEPEETSLDAMVARLDHTNPGFMSTYAQILSHLHQTVEQDQLKDELVAFADRIGKADVARSIPANRIGVEGKIAYCMNRGANLPPSSMDRINKLLSTKHQDDPETPDWEHLPETAKGRATQAYVACYSLIDNAKTMVLRGKLDQRMLAGEIRRIVNERAMGKAAIVKQLAEHYRDALIEAKGEDAIKDWVKPLSTIAETLSLMVSNRASVKAGARGAKARKMRSTVEQRDRKGEKAAAKVSYKDEDDSLGLRSVDPTNVVGAEAAVVFNTKTRHCEVYRAKEGSKLSVQGAKIVNFDEASSVGKTIRKPEVDLPHWTRATTLKRLEVLMSGIKGKTWELTGKLNKNCMIIKVL